MRKSFTSAEGQGNLNTKAGAKKDKGKKGRWSFGKKKTSADELEGFSLFVRMFGFLVRDGYTPDKAVSMMGTTAAGGLSHALKISLSKMEQGVVMSDAFRLTGYFPEEFCAVVAVGETTGSLGDALELYSEYIEKVLQMKKGFRSALAYPTLLLSFVFVMVAVMLFVVAPKFVEMLNEMGAARDKLPAISNLLFISYDFSKLVGKPIIVGIVILIVYYLLLGKGKEHIMKLLGHIPKIKAVNNRLNWSQWLMMGAICMRAGMLLNPMLGVLSHLPLPLEMAKKTGRGKTALPIYEQIKKNVHAGKTLSSEMKEAKVPEIITQMLGAAEKSGRMGEAMKSVAGQYLYSLSMDIKVIGTVVEQVAIGCVVLFGGGIVAVVAITMLSVSSAGI